jgi:predicted RNase H-like HicB family nuclease
VSDYHVNVFVSEEDGGHIADIPSLEACSAFGLTAEEALREVQEARAAWLDAAGAAGKPVPRPRYGPVIHQVSGARVARAHTPRSRRAMLWARVGSRR